ncbi:hypothetical protein DFJ73DRAFT_863849 [Zopfochytrium polystomum]|nr:hypothetical protein DFJ73DRAFT_863849 [Zopfochytrium polystomum]
MRGGNAGSLVVVVVVVVLVGRVWGWLYQRGAEGRRRGRLRRGRRKRQWLERQLAGDQERIRKDVLLLATHGERQHLLVAVALLLLLLLLMLLMLLLLLLLLGLVDLLGV